MSNPAPTPSQLRSTTRWPWRSAMLLALVLLAGIGYFTRADWLPEVAKFLNVGQNPGQVDYLLVLSGGVDTRPFAAGALYRLGVAPKVLTTNPIPDGMASDGDVPSEPEIFQRILVAMQVPEDDLVLLPGVVTSTFDEARVLANFLADKPEARVAVVTSNSHTRRARWVFRQHVPNPQRLVFVAVPTERFSEDNWWYSLDGWTTYLNEYMKFAWYVVRHRGD